MGFLGLVLPIIKVGTSRATWSSAILIQVLPSDADPTMGMVVMIRLSSIFSLNSMLSSRLFKVMRILRCLVVIGGQIVVVDG